jgi:hypothetical protein
MIGPNRERYGLIEFADEALDGSRTQPHCDDLIVFVTQRWPRLRRVALPSRRKVEQPLQCRWLVFFKDFPTLALAGIKLYGRKIFVDKGAGASHG